MFAPPWTPETFSFMLVGFVCVCVCVYEGERDRDRERKVMNLQWEKTKHAQKHIQSFHSLIFPSSMWILDMYMVHIQSQLANLYLCFLVSVVYRGSLVRDWCGTLGLSALSLMLTKAAFISSKYCKNSMLWYTKMYCFLFEHISKWKLFLWCKAEFSASLFQSSLHHMILQKIIIILLLKKHLLLSMCYI